MKTEELLSQFLQKTLNGIDATVSFFSAQLPDVIYQLLLWKAIQSGICFIVSVSVCGFIGYWLYRAIKESILNDTKPYLSQSDWPFLVLLLGSIGMVFFIIVVICSLDWLQIMVAPKLYLLEYAAHLVKGR